MTRTKKAILNNRPCKLAVYQLARITLWSTPPSIRIWFWRTQYIARPCTSQISPDARERWQPMTHDPRLTIDARWPNPDPTRHPVYNIPGSTKARVGRSRAQGLVHCSPASRRWRDRRRDHRCSSPASTAMLLAAGKQRLSVFSAGPPRCSRLNRHWI